MDFAGPSTLLRYLDYNDAGDEFSVVENEARARESPSSVSVVTVMLGSGGAREH